jgi:hypothetical protein
LTGILARLPRSAGSENRLTGWFRHGGRKADWSAIGARSFTNRVRTLCFMA